MRTWEKSRPSMKGFLAFSETDCKYRFDLHGSFVLRLYIWNGRRIHWVCVMDPLPGGVRIFVCRVYLLSGRNRLL